jgi:isopentenyl diphosphate isomerase/L-lactate dehydrogenase-like FMN-dependent dehydrogenase
VLIGRPYMYALAAGGERGVDRMIELLRNEIIRAMSFVGATSVAEIDASLINPGPAPSRAVDPGKDPALASVR